MPRCFCSRSKHRNIIYPYQKSTLQTSGTSCYLHIFANTYENPIPTHVLLGACAQRTCVEKNACAQKSFNRRACTRGQTCALPWSEVPPAHGVSTMQRSALAFRNLFSLHSRRLFQKKFIYIYIYIVVSNSMEKIYTSLTFITLLRVDG